MKKKYIIAVLILAAAIIFGLSAATAVSNRKEATIKANNEKKITQEQVIKKQTEIKKLDNEKKGANYLPPAIKKIDETNYDTYQWWNASEGQLLTQLSLEAKTYNDSQIESIVKNANEIPSYLIRLAVMHPESIPYVAGYQTRKLNQPINIDNYYTPGKIPLFEQFDKQWGYDFYGTGPLATDGCGPTALAMVVVGLTGNTSINPKVVADYSVNHGGYIDNQGSTWDLMTGVASHFGVDGTQIPESEVISELKAGHPVIVNVGPGLFTLTGHYMVLTGVTPDGKITLNDPDSIKYSQETWNFNQIAQSAKAFWSYSKAN